MNADQEACQAGKRHADVEGEQGQPVKRRSAARFSVLCQNKIGRQNRRLTDVIRRKNRGTGIAARDFEGVPLNRRDKYNRITGDKVAADERNRANQNDRGGRANQADDFHADFHSAAHQHIKHIAAAINQKAEQHKADKGKISLTHFEHHFNQVAGLGVAENIHMIKNRVAAPKAADHARGKVHPHLPTDYFFHPIIPNIHP